MTDELALKILAEIAAPGSGHLFSRRGAAAHAIALIQQQAARIAVLERERDEAIAAEEKVQELHDRAVKDAQRYRYIKSRSREEMYGEGVDLDWYEPTDGLDEMIDAAIAASSEKSGE